MQPDTDLGAFFASNILEHVINPVTYPMTGLFNQVGDIVDFEKILMVNLPIPGILVVDICEVTTVYGQTLAFTAVSLEGNVVDVDILDRSRAFYLDDVPLVPVCRSQDIKPGIDLARQYAGLEEWDSFILELPGFGYVTHEVICRDVDTIGKELLGQFTHEVPLVEDELGEEVGFGEPFGIVNL